MLSIWQKQSFSSDYDVVIIGAGLTGLFTAIKIKSARPEITVGILEKGSNPEGASVKNAGFACFGSISEILDDISAEGETKAFNRICERYNGLQELLSLNGLESIDLIRDDGFEIFTPDEESLFSECKKSIDYINSRLHKEIGVAPYSVINKSQGMNVLPEMIRIKGEASLHSGKLVKSLLRKAQNLDIDIHFRSELIEFTRKKNAWQCETAETTFHSKQLVFATNGFTPDLFPIADVQAARGQLLLTSSIPGLNLKGNYHIHRGYYYFRQLGQSILLGGGRHIDRMNENSSSQETTKRIQNNLEEMLRTVIVPGKDIKITDRWAGTMAFGPANEKEPIVQKSREGYYLGVRLGGMGVAMAGNVADKLKDLLLQEFN